MTLAFKPAEWAAVLLGQRTLKECLGCGQFRADVVTVQDGGAPAVACADCRKEHAL